MKQLDFDRVFPQTPACIPAAIEMGVRKGIQKMKLQNRIIALASAAAAIAVMIAVAAFAAGVIAAPPRTDILAQPETAPNASNRMIRVYSTEGADYYHQKQDCSGMENALEMSEIEAVQMGKKACPICIPVVCSGHSGEEIEFIYYSQGAKYFHKQAECSGGSFALKGEYFTVTRAFPGKEPCTACFPNGIEECVHGKAFIREKATPEPTPEATSEAILLPDFPEPKLNSVPSAAGDAVQSAAGDAVYFTKQGKFIHSDSNCMGMRNARRHTRADALEAGMPGCPRCLKVYFTEKGRYYHLTPDCTGMMNAQLHSMEEALAMRKERCTDCMCETIVFATEKGRYCHFNQNCSGMEGAKPLPLTDAVLKHGKALCPVCITAQVSLEI